MCDLLDMTPKAKQQNEKKKDNLGFIKIYNFCARKDTINTVKRQPKNGRIYLQMIYLIKG